MDHIIVNVSDESITFVIDEEIYSLQIISKTAYVFIDKFYIYLFYSDDNKLSARMKTKDGSMPDPAHIVGEFYNELLHQMLRYDISKETKSLRELILGRALYATCISDSPDASLDQESNQDIFYINNDYNSKNEVLGSQEDQLNIRKSWFDHE